MDRHQLLAVVETKDKGHEKEGNLLICGGVSKEKRAVRNQMPTKLTLELMEHTTKLTIITAYGLNVNHKNEIPVDHHYENQII